jgi:hypothetical protein
MDTTTTPHRPVDDVVAVTDRDRLVARLATITAVAAFVLSPLHALARHRTEDGEGDLELVTTRFWAEPLGDLLSPLLTWADPDLVYVTYGKLWLPVFVLFTAAAFLARRHRRPRGFEKGAWWVVLVAYCGACGSVVGEYWTQWTGETNALLDVVFLASIPFVLLTMLGSTTLGITLLVKRYRPRATAILLACAVPGLFVIPMFTSLGGIVLPLAVAWALAARSLVARADLTDR